MEEKLKEVQECFKRMDKVYDELKEKFFNTIPDGTVIYSVNDDEEMIADGTWFTYDNKYGLIWMEGTKFLVKDKKIRCIQAIEDDELTDIDGGYYVPLGRENYELFGSLADRYGYGYHVPEDEAASIEITY